MNNLRFSQEAEADLTDIWVYQSEYGETQADKLIGQVLDQITMLASFPEAGRKRSEVAAGLRSFVIERHIVFYRPDDQGIEIVRIVPC